MEKATLIELLPNAIKITTEKLMGGAFHKKVDEITDTIRFDDDIYANQEISDTKFLECVKLFKTYKELCDAKGVSRICVYASPIFEGVRNTKNMFDEILKTTSLPITVMTEEEEVKNIYNSVVGAVDTSKGVCLYVGTHRTYVLNFAKRSLNSYYVLPFGSNSLAHDFKCTEGADAHKIMTEMVDFVAKKIREANIVFDFIEEIRFVGSGPAFLTLSKLVRKMTHYPLDLDNNFYVTLDNINKALALLEEQGFDHTKRLANISNDRLADIMSGVAIIKAFAEEKNVDTYNISARTVGDAIMSTKIVKENTCDSTSNDLCEIAMHNAKFYYPIDESNSDNVYNLTLELYRQMSIIHKLTRKQVKSLKIASFLYDCGKRIAFENHSKFSRDIILSAGLLNVSHKDLLVAAFGCQCQNLDNFNLADWVKYKSIVDEEDMMSARKIGTLIALASALDAGKQNKITEISCDLLGDIVIIKAKTEVDATYEIYETAKVLPAFKKVFRKAFQIM